MYANLFSEFLTSGDTLQVYEDDKSIFTSSKDGLLPLLEYIDNLANHHQQVVIFDKIMGNAAALLSVKVRCREVYSPLGSELAIRTLEQYGIEYNLTTIVPYIQKPDSQDMCPMESLSINKGPEEFCELVRNTIKQ